MPGFSINNSKEGYYTKLFILNESSALYDDIIDLIGSGGGGGTTNLSLYLTGTQIYSLLAGKVNNSQVLTDVPIDALFTDTL